MKELLSNPAFRHYVFCAVALAFNPLVLASMTGGFRGKYKSPANPEDAKLSGNPFTEQNAPEVERIIRAHRNALENIPITLIAGLLYVLVGASPTMVLALMGTCAVFRWLHSIFYLRSAQPWRTISFALSSLATAIMLVHSVVLTLQSAG
jgi:microsomal prostaglandin-E synthase 1